MDGEVGRLFGFEAEYREDLHFIPMAIRYRLDLAGWKFSLESWQRISAADRFGLLATPVTPEGLRAFGAELHRLLAGLGVPPPAPAPPSLPAAWGPDEVPEAVRSACGLAGIVLPEGRWSALAEIRRYALLKLSRSRHGGGKFKAACEEFGVG